MLKIKDRKISLADVIHNSLFWEVESLEQENLVAVFLLVVEDLDTVPFKDSSEWLI